MKRFKFITTNKNSGVLRTDAPELGVTEYVWSGEWVRAEDHDHEVEILKATIADLTHAFDLAADRADRAEAEVGRLHKECAKRRLDCKRLRKERDELIIAMKDIVAIWEAHEGTEEEDGERMASLAEEMSNKWGI